VDVDKFGKIIEGKRSLPRKSLVDAAKKDFPAQRLCKVLGVSASGYFAWKSRPACRRPREDRVLLAHVRSAFTLSNGT
jgi:putative transposase